MSTLLSLEQIDLKLNESHVLAASKRRTQLRQVHEQLLRFAKENKIPFVRLDDADELRLVKALTHGATSTDLLALIQSMCHAFRHVLNFREFLGQSAVESRKLERRTACRGLRDKPASNLNSLSALFDVEGVERPEECPSWSRIYRWVQPVWSLLPRSYECLHSNGPKSLPGTLSHEAKPYSAADEPKFNAALRGRLIQYVRVNGTSALRSVFDTKLATQQAMIDQDPEGDSTERLKQKAVLAVPLEHIFTGPPLQQPHQAFHPTPTLFNADTTLLIPNEYTTFTDNALVLQDINGIQLQWEHLQPNFFKSYTGNTPGQPHVFQTITPRIAQPNPPLPAYSLNDDVTEHHGRHYALYGDGSAPPATETNETELIQSYAVISNLSVKIDSEDFDVNEFEDDFEPPAHTKPPIVRNQTLAEKCRDRLAQKRQRHVTHPIPTELQNRHLLTENELYHSHLKSLTLTNPADMLTLMTTPRSQIVTQSKARLDADYARHLQQYPPLESNETGFTNFSNAELETLEQTNTTNQKLRIGRNRLQAELRKHNKLTPDLPQHLQNIDQLTDEQLKQNQLEYYEKMANIMDPCMREFETDDDLIWYAKTRLEEALQTFKEKYTPKWPLNAIDDLTDEEILTLQATHQETIETHTNPKQHSQNKNISFPSQTTESSEPIWHVETIRSVTGTLSFEHIQSGSAAPEAFALLAALLIEPDLDTHYHCDNQSVVDRYRTLLQKHTFSSLERYTMPSRSIWNRIHRATRQRTKPLTIHKVRSHVGRKAGEPTLHKHVDIEAKEARLNAIGAGKSPNLDTCDETYDDDWIIHIDGEYIAHDIQRAISQKANSIYATPTKKSYTNEVSFIGRPHIKHQWPNGLHKFLTQTAANTLPTPSIKHRNDPNQTSSCICGYPNANSAHIWHCPTTQHDIAQQLTHISHTLQEALPIKFQPHDILSETEVNELLNAYNCPDNNYTYARLYTDIAETNSVIECNLTIHDQPFTYYINEAKFWIIVDAFETQNTKNKNHENKPRRFGIALATAISELIFDDHQVPENQPTPAERQHRMRNQWATRPELIQILLTECNLDHELFSSVINHHPGLLTHSSLGTLDATFGFTENAYSFPWSGRHIYANPPWEEKEMRRMIDRI